MSISLLVYVYLLPLCCYYHRNDNVSYYVQGGCSYLHWSRLVEDSHTAVCLFGFSCHWYGADLLSTDPVEL